MGIFAGSPLGISIGAVSANDVLGFPVGLSHSDLSVIQVTTNNLHHADSAMETILQNIPSTPQTNSEIMTLELQSVVSQRSLVLQLATDLLHSMHDAEHQILQNIRDGSPSHPGASAAEPGAPHHGASADSLSTQNGASQHAASFESSHPADTESQPFQAHGADTEPTIRLADIAARLGAESGIDPTSHTMDGGSDTLDNPGPPMAGEALGRLGTTVTQVVGTAGEEASTPHPSAPETGASDDRGAIVSGGGIGSPDDLATLHVAHSVDAPVTPTGIASGAQADNASETLGHGAATEAVDSIMGATQDQVTAAGIIIVGGQPADAGSPHTSIGHVVQSGDHDFWHQAAQASGFDSQAGITDGIDKTALGSTVSTLQSDGGRFHPSTLVSSMQELHLIHGMDVGPVEGTSTAHDVVPHAGEGLAHLGMDHMASLAPSHQGPPIIVHHIDFM